MLDAIKHDVIRTEQQIVADITLSYKVFRSKADIPDLAFYDENGTIYIPAELLEFNKQYAQLIALHEHVEIQHKSAGRPHAYAHRRALLAELMAAKQIFTEPGQLESYLDWRIRLYPEWKRFGRADAVTQLGHILATSRPRKGDLFQLIKAYSL